MIFVWPLLHTNLFHLQVDCFSYGMLLYEIVTVRQPFEGHEAVKEAVLEGARPSLSPRVSQPNTDTGKYRTSAVG